MSITPESGGSQVEPTAIGIENRSVSMRSGLGGIASSAACNVADRSGAKVAVIGHVAREDRPALVQALDSHTVIDLLGLEELSHLPGVTYEGLCW